jgi:uncharacterized membrane-anchored protein
VKVCANDRALLNQLTRTQVPEITVVFWILKLLTTAMGEAMSDAMGGVTPILDGCVCLALFIATMFVQFRATEYWAPYYWSAVAAVAIAGTAFADALAAITGLDSPYVVTVPLYSVLTFVVFAVWYYEERSLSIHSINCRRQEGFYWWAVVMTFSLGTALGDLLAYPPVELGFLNAFFIYSGIFAVGIVMFLFNLVSKWKINTNFIFWYCYVWTRPVGASLIDLIAQPLGEACLEPFASSVVATTSFVAPSSTAKFSTMFTGSTTTLKKVHTTTTAVGQIGVCPNELSLNFGSWQSSLVALGLFIILVAIQTIFKRDIQSTEEQVHVDDGVDKVGDVAIDVAHESKPSLPEEAAVLASRDATEAVAENEEAPVSVDASVVPSAPPVVDTEVVPDDGEGKQSNKRRKSRKVSAQLVTQSTEAVFGTFAATNSAESPPPPRAGDAI